MGREACSKHKTKGLFCPRSPPGQLVTNATGKLRAREGEKEGQGGRKTVLQNKNELTLMRGQYKINESLRVTLSCPPYVQKKKPG